jgi:DNA polymerase III epsilon subunit-like protein
MKLLIALDFETTGLDSEKSKIIEVGAVKFNESNKTWGHPLAVS